MKINSLFSEMPFFIHIFAVGTLVRNGAAFLRGQNSHFCCMLFLS